MRALFASTILLLTGVLVPPPAHAGPPYVSDDPQPTERGHYEVYFFTSGTTMPGAWEGAGGIDFNYGAAPHLQLTAVLPVAWSSSNTSGSVAGLGNIELAAKYKFIDQGSVGVDAAVFPRVFLPAGSARLGERHVSLLIPVWIQRSSGSWTTFGGGGCVINRGGESRNFCQVGWAVVRQFTPELQIGAELYHQGAPLKGGRAGSGMGLGFTYDWTQHLHLMGSAGPGLQNAAETGTANWYAAVLFTF